VDAAQFRFVGGDHDDHDDDDGAGLVPFSGCSSKKQEMSKRENSIFLQHDSFSIVTAHESKKVGESRCEEGRCLVHFLLIILLLGGSSICSGGGGGEDSSYFFYRVYILHLNKYGWL